MADLVFNIAKGAVAEKVRDSAANIGILLLKVVEADATLKDRDTIAALLAAANTEADFTNYLRKTGITGTISVDDVNEWVDVDIPDQTWTAAGVPTNNNLVKLITYYDEGGTDATRIPLTAHDFVVTTDGTDLTAQIPTGGFYRAS